MARIDWVSSWSLVYVPGSDAFDTRNVPHSSGHTWLNWRDYLSAFAPQLFQ